MGPTLATYDVMPWLRRDRGPHQPEPAVLVDLTDRRFFWIETWPQDSRYVAATPTLARNPLTGEAAFVACAPIGVLTATPIP